MQYITRFNICQKLKVKLLFQKQNKTLNILTEQITHKIFIHVLLIIIHSSSNVIPNLCFWMSWNKYTIASMNSSTSDFTSALKEIWNLTSWKSTTVSPKTHSRITTYKHSRICILILPGTSQQSMVQEVVHTSKRVSSIPCVLWIDVTN